MNLRIFVSSVAVALMALGSTSVQADDIVADLNYDTSDSSWELYLSVVAGTPDTVDGSNGIAAFLATFDGLDYGTDGDAVTFEAGLGAITESAGDPTVIDTGSGIEFLYGQDISETVSSVVTGVGTSSTLIASGTFTIAPTTATGVDGTFLDAASSPFGVVDPDNIIVNINDVTPAGGLVGDYDDSGVVAQGDLDIVLLNWGGSTFSGNEANIPGGVFTDPMSQNELDGVLLNWGNTVAAAAAVPEPTSLVLVGMAMAAGLIRRK